MLAPWTWLSRDRAQAPCMKFTQTCKSFIYQAFSVKMTFFTLLLTLDFVLVTNPKKELG